MRQIILGAIVVLALAGAAYAAFIGLSELKLRDVKRPAAFDYAINMDQATIERGLHIARTRGCFSCHGKNLEGVDFSGEWDWVERGVAPNIAAIAKVHDAATLEMEIRHGLRHDGRAFWSMPSFNFVRLNDEDTAALIALLKSAPVVESALPKPKLGRRARWLLVSGEENHMATWALQVPFLRLGPDDDPALARGEYLAMTTCNECHGLDLRGASAYGFSQPDLAIVAGYPEEDFRKLMKDGVGLGGREDLGLMSIVAQSRFVHFTDQELSDLHAFLSSLAEIPAPEGVWWRE